MSKLFQINSFVQNFHPTIFHWNCFCIPFNDFIVLGQINMKNGELLKLRICYRFLKTIGFEAEPLTKNEAEPLNRSHSCKVDKFTKTLNYSFPEWLLFLPLGWTIQIIYAVLSLLWICFHMLILFFISLTMIVCCVEAVDTGSMVFSINKRKPWTQSATSQNVG